MEYPTAVPERSCVNCHFFVKMTNSGGPTPTVSFVTTEERQKIKSGADPGTLVNDYRVLSCRKGVWDSANLPTETRGKLRPLLMAERGESCFFFPDTPGMFMPAALELERAAADRREAERDRALTRQTARAASRAAWAAIIVAATAALIALAKLLLEWLKQTGIPWTPC